MTICHLTNVRRTMATNGSTEVPRYAQIDKTKRIKVLELKALAALLRRNEIVPHL